jgi:hypothetical protein
LNRLHKNSLLGMGGYFCVLKPLVHVVVHVGVFSACSQGL